MNLPDESVIMGRVRIQETLVLSLRRTPTNPLDALPLARAGRLIFRREQVFFSLEWRAALNGASKNQFPTSSTTTTKERWKERKVTPEYRARVRSGAVHWREAAVT